MNRVGEFVILGDDEEAASGLVSPVPAEILPMRVPMLVRVLDSRRRMVADPAKFGLTGEALADTQNEFDVLRRLLPGLVAVAREVEAAQAQAVGEIEAFLQGGDAGQASV